MQSTRRHPIAACGMVVLLAASVATAQTRLDDRQLVRLVGEAVADQSNRGAFRQVIQNYDRYRKLVAAGKVPAANVEVFDNQVWSLSLRVWDNVKGAYPEGLERVDLVGSGGRRLEAGSKYIVGKSDLDFIPRGPAAEEAAAAYMKQLAAELGADPQKIGINALSPVQAEKAALISAANHPEKYCTPERLKVLDYQQYSTGMTVVWESGQAQRVSVRDLYARNGWPPPPEPTALDAFGSAAAEGKFLNESVHKGLTGAQKAVYEAKYHTRTIDSAVNLGGVELPAGSAAVERELRAIAEAKSVRTALADRIARHGGNVEVAVAEYLRDAANLNQQVTSDLLRKHVKLLQEKAAAGGEALAEAQQSIRQLQHSLAIYSDAQTRELLQRAGLKPEAVETVAGKVSKFRIEIAVEGERAAIEAQKLARIIAAQLPPAERAAFEAQLATLTKNAAGQTLLQNIAETMRARPVSSALIAWAAVSEVRHVAQVAGEQGWTAGGQAAANAAGDWYLMSLSPHYAVARLAIDLGKLGVEVAFVGPVKETAAKEAYQGDAGFLAHIGLSRGELTRRFATEAEALREARQWYQKWMVNKGEFLGKAEVEESFYRQVRADYETSHWLQMARDYSFDPQTGEYGKNGFFRRFGRGQITFENFAQWCRTEESALRAINRYLEDTWFYDREKYGGQPTDRAAREDLLRRYLLELWKASAKFNEDLKKTRDEAEQQVATTRGPQADRDEGLETDLLKPPTDDSTVAIDEIRRAATVHEALKRTWPLLRTLERRAREFRDEVAALSHLTAAVDGGKRSLEVYAQAIETDREFLESTEKLLVTLRTAIASGVLQPAATEKLLADFRAVKAEADRIAASADRTLADAQAGQLTPAVVRQQYLALLERYRLAKSQFIPANEAFERLSDLSRIRMLAEDYKAAQCRIGEHLLAGCDLIDHLQATADGMDARLAALQQQAEEFDALKAQLEELVAEFRDRAGDNTAEAKSAQVLQSRLAACVIPAVPEAQALSTAGAMRRLIANWQEQTATAAKPRRVLAFEEFEPPAAVAAERVPQLAPVRDEAAQALENAHAALERLAKFIVSRPTRPEPNDTVRAEPPRPIPATRPQPPTAAPGSISIREPSRNVFAVEMANLPAGARFIWDFGDGSPRAQTTQPQVQHDYKAPTGGIAGLAGKKWQMGVTVVVNGQSAGSATYTVSRGRLSDTPIQKRQ